MDDALDAEEPPFGQDDASSEDEREADRLGQPELSFIPNGLPPIHTVPPQRSASVASSSSRPPAPLEHEDEEQQKPDFHGNTIFVPKAHNMGVTDAANASASEEASTISPDQLLDKLDAETNEVLETIEVDEEEEEEQGRTGLNAPPTLAEHAPVGQKPILKAGRSKAHASSPPRTPQASSARTAPSQKESVRRRTAHMGAREHDQRFNQLQNENQLLKFELNALRQRYYGMGQDVSEQLKEENLHLVAENRELKKSKGMSDRLLKSQDRALKEAARHVAELEAALKLKGSVRGSQTELEQLLRARSDLERRLREREQEAAHLRRNGRIVYSDTGAQAHIERLQADLDAERDARDAAIAQRDQSRAQSRQGRISRTPAGSFNEVEEYMDQIDQLNDKNEGLMEQIAAQAAQASRLSAERDQANDQILILEQDIANLQADLQLVRHTGADGDDTTILNKLVHERDIALDQLANARLAIDELITDQDKRDQLWSADKKAILQWQEESNRLMEELAMRQDQLKEFKIRFEELASLIRAKDEEAQKMEQDIRNLTASITELDETERLHSAEIEDLLAQLDEARQQAADQQHQYIQMSTVYKEKLNAARKEAKDIKAQHELVVEEVRVYRKDLASKTKELDGEIEQRRSLERAKRDSERNAQDEVERQRIAHEETRAELERAEVRMRDLEKDADRLQAALSTTQTASNDRVGLEVERDRLKQDLVAAREDANRLRIDLRKSQADYLEAKTRASALASEKRDMESKLANQTSSRLAVSDKLDEALENWRKAQAELTEKAQELATAKGELAKGARTISRADGVSKEILTERMSFLNKLSKEMDNVLGEKRTDLRVNSPIDTIQDRLVSRLHLVGSLQASFAKRIKEFETRLTEQYGQLKRQQDSKLQRLDTFDDHVRQAKDTQQKWRRRVAHTQAELEAAQSTNHELQRQIKSPRTDINGNGDSSLERELVARNERIAQLEAVRNSDRAKYSASEAQWIARLKEYENRTRASEEKVKRERQGAKERLYELNDHVSDLQKQVDVTRRRDNRMGDIVAKVRLPSDQ